MSMPSGRAASVADSQQQGGVASAGIRGSAPETRHPVEFTARAGEYFRIWIVNLALSIVTLGIYSAWAKVRKRRYFCGHTHIAGEAFEYRARPLAILKGRLIAFGLLALFYGVGYAAPLWQWLVWIPLLVVAPWLLVRSIAFNAYNTAHRGLRFRFSGTYGECARIAAGYGLLVLVTLGLAYPYLKRRLVRFLAERHAYGTTPFALDAGFGKPFIHAYAVAYGLGVLGGLLLFFGLTLAGRGQALAMVPLVVLGFYGVLFVLFAYVRARTANALWNHLAIGPVRFECALRARDLVALYLGNILAIALTLGLATPWAAVRTMRYRASRMTAIADAPLDQFAQAESARVSVAGEEVAEMFDIDIAL